MKRMMAVLILAVGVAACSAQRLITETIPGKTLSRNTVFVDASGRLVLTCESSGTWGRPSYTLANCVPMNGETWESALTKILLVHAKIEQSMVAEEKKRLDYIHAQLSAIHDGLQHAQDQIKAPK